MRTANGAQPYIRLPGIRLFTVLVSNLVIGIILAFATGNQPHLAIALTPITGLAVSDDTTCITSGDTLFRVSTASLFSAETPQWSHFSFGKPLYGLRQGDQADQLTIMTASATLFVNTDGTITAQYPVTGQTAIHLSADNAAHSGSSYVLTAARAAGLRWLSVANPVMPPETNTALGTVHDVAGTANQAGQAMHIWAASNSGLYRASDPHTAWTQIASGGYTHLHLLDHNTLIAVEQRDHSAIIRLFDTATGRQNAALALPEVQVSHLAAVGDQLLVANANGRTSGLIWLDMQAGTIKQRYRYGESGAGGLVALTPYGALWAVGDTLRVIQEVNTSPVLLRVISVPLQVNSGDQGGSVFGLPYAESDMQSGPAMATPIPLEQFSIRLTPQNAPPTPAIIGVMLLVISAVSLLMISAVWFSRWITRPK